ncbi:MAG: ABC transporter ATP-binding protein [Phycisphaeraceae bacterium]|nr:ABC transporter ATP-binding protein [Phycisphaeraceae bacterium]
MTAVEVDDLCFAYGRTAVLRHVGFDVQPGEFVSIIGPNGSGKSTLIKCINRILAGWTGRIALSGTSVRAMSQKAIATRIGYVPQVHEGPLPFTVEEFVLLGRYPYVNPLIRVREEDRREIGRILERTGLSPLSGRNMATLSGGEHQAVFIAAALAQGARTLLLDEPAAFLDYRHQVESASMLRQMHRDMGVTILCVTHDVNQALAASDRVLALKDGQVAYFGPPASLLDNGLLERLYATSFARLPREANRLPWLVPCGGPS